MDIKLKNKFTYIAAYILCIYIISLSAMTGYDIIRYRYCFQDKPYFHSSEFKSELDRFMMDVLDVYQHSANPSKYAELKSSVESRKDIKYYILDKKNNTTYTNIKSISNINDYIKAKSLFNLKFPTNNAKGSYQWFVSSSFKDSGFEGYFIVPNDTGAYSELSKRIEFYNDIKIRISKEVPIFIASLIIGLTLFWFLENNRSTSLEISLIKKIKRLYKRIPFDLRVVLFIFYIFMFAVLLDNTVLLAEPFFLNKLMILSTTVIFLLCLIPNIRETVRLLKNKENLKSEWGESLIHKFSIFTKELFIIRDIALKTIVIIILGISFIMISSDEFIILELAYIIFVPYYIIKNVGYLNKILNGTEEISSGNLNYSIEEKGKGHMSQLAHNINNMRSSFKNSLESEMKSERFKSELITNVSHDLRTPLTSIINYINLLKKEDLSKEEIDGYISVVDRKAQRLKVLIDDLFEASKMASGAVELDIEKVDIVSLLNQAVGELDEKIKNSSLTFRVNTSKPHIYLELDGKKTWRVFENLIGNILKYSQPNTRVYIDMLEEDSCVKITMKNISSYELNFDTEEIFERFKRGDKSRNTEGSGLGLAIAKSIVELHHGKLSIEIDGDLFKVIVELPKQVLI